MLLPNGRLKMCSKLILLVGLLKSVLKIRGDDVSGVPGFGTDITKTIQTSFSSMEYMPTVGDTATPVTSNSTADPGGGSVTQREKGTANGGNSSCNSVKYCKRIVMQCGRRALRSMRNGFGTEEDNIFSPDDRCKCVYHCLQTEFGKTWQNNFLRRNGRPHHELHDEDHTVLNHLGELIGTFGTGTMVGVFMALLIVNLIRRFGRQTPEPHGRETRSPSNGGLPATLRGPMPPPVQASEGIYTEGPLGSPPSKLDRVSSKGLYEDLDGNESGGYPGGNRPSSKESGQNVYFVLENETANGDEESEKEEDADNMPNETISSDQQIVPPAIIVSPPQPQTRKPKVTPRNQTITEESKL